MQLQSLVHLLGRNLGNCRYAAVGSPFIFLHQQHVDHAVKVRAALQGILDGNHVRSECLAQLLHHIVVVGLLAVHLVKGEHHRLLQRGSGAEYVLRSYLDAIVGIDQYQTQVAYSECRIGVTHEVLRAGAIYEI